MLPGAYFDKLTHALGVRTDQRATERRKAIRVPASFRPEIYAVGEGRLSKAMRVRSRDISSTGLAVLAPKDLPRANQFVLDLKPGDGRERFVLLCKVRRTTKLDGMWTVVGLSFEGVLAPGQTVAPEVAVESLTWIDVSGNTVPDEAALVA